MRQDAARNANRVLDAAARLVAENGAAAVTMDAVAAAAGVGKGTVFRRFGSREGLMTALLDHTERGFQQEFLTGPPPLGPGAAPADRLEAFGRRRLAMVAAHAELMAATGRRVPTAVAPATTLSRTHVRMLLAQAGVTGDVELLAAHLVHALDPSWVSAQTTHLGHDPERVASAWVHLVRCVLARCESGEQS